MKNNIGEAILILGIIYFLATLELSWWKILLLILLIGLALVTWSINRVPKEQKELLTFSVVKLKLEIELMKAQTKFYVAQGLAIVRNLKRN